MAVVTGKKTMDALQHADGREGKTEDVRIDRSSSFPFDPTHEDAHQTPNGRIETVLWNKEKWRCGNVRTTRAQQERIETNAILQGERERRTREAEPNAAEEDGCVWDATALARDGMELTQEDDGRVSGTQGYVVRKGRGRVGSGKPF